MKGQQRVGAATREPSENRMNERATARKHGAPTLVATCWCGAGMRPEAGPRGKPAEGSDHGQSGGRMGKVFGRTRPAGCRPPPAVLPSRSDPGRWRFRYSRPRNRNRSPLTVFHATVPTAREKSDFKAGLHRGEKSGFERG